MEIFLENGPSYAEKDLSLITHEHEMFSDKFYEEIFLQTGLGRSAVDKLYADNNTNQFDIYQRHLFRTNRIIKSRKISPITYEEYMVNAQDKQIKHPELVDIQEGDILISLNTHSLGWRHGHAGIVTDAEKKLTLEAISLGQNTAFQPISKWLNYPSVIQLRLKDNHPIHKVVAYAKSKLYDIPYGLLSGLFDKLKTSLTTQCAHLVWSAYKHLNIDLNSDGGWLVTPIDILKSTQLEIVQILGISPTLFTHPVILS